MDLYVNTLIYVLLSVFLLIHWEETIDESASIWSDVGTLIVVAHPDDETMFFGPLLINLISRQPQRVFILCLSSGNFYGLGDTRSKELFAAADLIGLPKGNLFLSNQFIDGFDQSWNSHTISLIVGNKIKENNISRIVTFDALGVSGHPNHIAVHSGIRQFISSSNRLMPSIELYELESLPLHRKYLSFLEIPISLIDCLSSGTQRKWLFGLTPSKYLKLIRSLFAHESQMVWFRRLYSIFSRYMFVNTINEKTKFHGIKVPIVKVMGSAPGD